MVKTGSSGRSFSLPLQEKIIIDFTDTEAFLVRKDGDTGDVLIVDTTNSRVGVGGAPTASAFHVVGGDITVDDTHVINFGHADHYIKCDTTNYWPGNYLVKGSGGLCGIGTDAELIFYANMQVDGGGNWTPEFRLKADGGASLSNTSQGDAADRYFHINMTSGVTIQVGNVSIGAAAPMNTAKLFVDQGSTTAAIPVLLLEQGDESEEFIRFIGDAAAANLTNDIIAEASVTTASRAGFLKIYVRDDGNQITDQAYFIPIFTLV